MLGCAVDPPRVVAARAPTSDTHQHMAAHMAPKGHRRRWAGISLTIAAIVATVVLVQAQHGSGPTLDTGPAPEPTSPATVLGEVITRGDLPEANAATPATLAPGTTAASPTTKASKPRSTTTVPAPRLIPPVTVENTTSTSTTTAPSPTTTESPTTSTPEP